MSQKLKYIQQALNNSGIQNRDPALFQVLQQIVALQQTEEIVNNELTQQDGAFQNSQWLFYQPGLYVASGTPAVGTDGLLHGYYRIIDSICYFYIRWVLGTSFSFGTSGTFGFTLPFRKLTLPSMFGWYTSSGEALDVGINAYRLNTVITTTSTNLDIVALFTFLNQRANVSATAPFTFVAGDEIQVNGYYPIAYDGEL